MQAECVILGCGGSNGVPQICCNCAVCLSNDIKNTRTRASIMLSSANNDFNLLIDSAPDLRQQIIREKITKIDAVLISHIHYDHTAGLNDMRLMMPDNINGNFSKYMKNNTLNLRENDKKSLNNVKPQKISIPLLTDEKTALSLQKVYCYVFYGDESYNPIFQLNSYAGPFSLGGQKGFTIMPFFQQHGKSFSYGYRIGNLAYSTDFNYLSEEALKILHNIDIWIVDCMRYGATETHCNLDLTLDYITKVQPKLAILTHMSHEIDYFELSARLPSNIRLAYDGMRVKFNADI
jgi:phosphoribosyl 1,2-cyclic phosphate phosphodiesterase